MIVEAKHCFINSLYCLKEDCTSSIDNKFLWIRVMVRNKFHVYFALI